LDGNAINLDAKVQLTTFDFENLRIDLAAEREYGNGEDAHSELKMWDVDDSLDYLQQANHGSCSPPNGNFARNEGIPTTGCVSCGNKK
jgi:hypothetical protein